MRTGLFHPATAFGRLLVVVLFCAICCRAAFAQEKHEDHVVLQTPGKSGRIVLQCTIVDYTGRTITLRTVAGAKRRYPATHVVKVRTPQTPSHVSGLRKFLAGKYADAVTDFESALQFEDRAWVKRELLSLVVRCHRKQGDLHSAAVRFLAILENEKNTRHFGEIPLFWTPRKIDGKLKAQAKLWLFESQPAAKLIAGCVLLRDGMYGKTAEETLQGLRADTDSHIRALATAQLWRKKLEQGAPDAGELKLWKKTAEKLPGKLRAGPYYLLGRAYQMRNEHERAAAAFLWIPLVFDDDPQLAARANLEAAEALAEAGQKREAMTLYREVQTRFSKTEFAQEAAMQERKLESSRAKR